MKVLHLPSTVGGMPWGLAEGERALGLDSTVLIRYDNSFRYDYNYNIGLETCNNNIIRMKKLLAAFYHYRKGYDVYHFNFGSSLIDAARYNLNLWDLAFYDKKARKVVTYNGCDARQKYATIQRTSYSACHNDDCYDGICMDSKHDVIARKRIAKMSSYVDHIFAVNPDLLWFLPEGATFLPYTISNFDDIEYQGEVAQKKVFTIVHAPTQRGAKGTEYILPVLNKIEQSTKNIKVILVENVPRAEALNIYSQADLVVDQLLVGWYGALAVEVMKMGKPVVCYIREEDLKFVPEPMRKDLPLIEARIDNFEDVVYYCIENPDFLREKARASLEYVQNWHNPRYVAGLVKEYY